MVGKGFKVPKGEKRPTELDEKKTSKITIWFERIGGTIASIGALITIGATIKTILYNQFNKKVPLTLPQKLKAIFGCLKK